MHSMMIEKENEVSYDQRHGGPYDRGQCDSYYRRSFSPHYFKGGTSTSEMVSLGEMTAEQIVAYTAGYNDNERSGFYKDWL